MLLAYTITIFLSASLLFLVQPMIAKMVLPLLGGSPAVWNTSMVFFQAVLLAGYLYAHLLTRRLAPARQVVVHACVLTIPLIVIVATGHLPVLDPRTFPPPIGIQPALWLLGALALAVGAPFFVLSTTGPLMQRWFASTTHRHAKDPYFLYAASNIGSMLALLGYPLVMERTLHIGEQRWWFSAGFAAFIALAIACGVMMLRARPAEPVNRHERRREAKLGAPPPLDAAPPPPPIPLVTKARWVLLAAVPSSLMLGVTQHMSSDIASFPLMWVIPLALYLLTFILAFSSRGVPVEKLSFLYFLVAGFLAMSLLGRMGSPVWAIIAAHMLGFFLGALVCHGRLAHERPDPRHLTEFFLLIAIGGVLGGSFNALLAPIIFNDIAEYPIIIAAACLLTSPSFGDRRPGRDPAQLPLMAWLREIVFLTLVALVWAAAFLWASQGGIARPADYWVFFSITTAALAAYILWRARGGHLLSREAEKPVLHDAFAPLIALLYVVGVEAWFRHAGWVGGWYAAAALILSVALLALRLARPRDPRVSTVADVAVPAILAFVYLMSNPAVRAAQEVTVDGKLMSLGPIKYVVVFAPPALLLMMCLGRRLRFALSVALIMALYYNYAGAADTRLLTTRTFFGVHRVSTDAAGAWRLLSHGTTRHGIQSTDPRLAMVPTMYYHPTGPIGQVFKSRESDPSFDQVAIVGLGTGGLAAYGREGVTFTFYEIDPEVVWIARDSGLYTYLDQTKAKVDLVLGDGRLMLSKAPDRKYDLIILDAFSSDSIPVHLITREAARLYFEKLADGGILVFHVSNRYLEARPILAAIGNDINVVTLTREDNKLTEEEEREGKLPTTWVILARRYEDFGTLLEDERWQEMRARPEAPRWTDDYSNILPLLQWK